MRKGIAVLILFTKQKGRKEERVPQIFGKDGDKSRKLYAVPNKQTKPKYLSYETKLPCTSIVSTIHIPSKYERAP